MNEINVVGQRAESASPSLSRHSDLASASTSVTPLLHTHTGNYKLRNVGVAVPLPRPGLLLELWVALPTFHISVPLNVSLDRSRCRMFILPSLFRDNFRGFRHHLAR